MKVAINGLGRIGRLVLKIGLERGLKVVAVNDLTDIKTLAYLLKYDSVYGPYNKKVEVGKGFLKIGSKKIKVFAEADPGRIERSRDLSRVAVPASSVGPSSPAINPAICLSSSSESLAPGITSVVTSSHISVCLTICRSVSNTGSSLAPVRCR